MGGILGLVFVLALGWWAFSWFESIGKQNRAMRMGKQLADRDKAKAAAKLRTKLGREPTEEEVCNELWHHSAGYIESGNDPPPYE
jgi:DNA-directed RNA polymerase specialized sigma subunit